MKKNWSLFFAGVLLFCGVDVKAEKLSCNYYLAKGSSGNQVKILQEELNDSTGCSLDVDGIFGKKTYDCLVKYQKNNRLSVDGIVGKNTCNKLNSVNINYGNSLRGDNDYSESFSDGDYEEEMDDDYSESFSSEDYYWSDDSYSYSDDYTEAKNKSLNDLKDGDYLAIIKSDVEIYDNPRNLSVVEETPFGNIYKYLDKINVNDKEWYIVRTKNGVGYVNSDNVATSFIIVDISAQRLKYFKHNEVVVDTNIVTGMQNDHDTPTGYYLLNKANKQRGKTLKGYNDDGSKYSAYVEYWMPFINDRGIGFHDASWRSSDEFNNETYTYDGSHGCVNMPSSAAKKLYKSLTYKKEDVIVRD